MLPVCANLEVIIRGISQNLKEKYQGSFYNDEISISCETEDGRYFENLITIEEKESNTIRVNFLFDNNSNILFKEFNIFNNNKNDIYEFIESKIDEHLGILQSK